jgi:hypothetical protein
MLAFGSVPLLQLRNRRSLRQQGMRYRKKCSANCFGETHILSKRADHAAAVSVVSPLFGIWRPPGEQSATPRLCETSVLDARPGATDGNDALDRSDRSLLLLLAAVAALSGVVPVFSFHDPIQAAF